MAVRECKAEVSVWVCMRRETRNDGADAVAGRKISLSPRILNTCELTEIASGRQGDVNMSLRGMSPQSIARSVLRGALAGLSFHASQNAGVQAPRHSTNACGYLVDRRATYR